MSKVMLSYSFIFEAGSPWSHLSQFEKSLADFFNIQGLEAEVVMGIGEQSNSRLFVIKKAQNHMPTRKTNAVSVNFNKK